MEREYRTLYARDDKGVIWDEIVCWRVNKHYYGQWIGQGIVKRISKAMWDRAEKEKKE